MPVLLHNRVKVAPRNSNDRAAICRWQAFRCRHIDGGVGENPSLVDG
jgi:hypothetical protein